jgi:hypothetical protein
LVLAGIAATRRDPDKALEYLAAAERACQGADMNLHAAVARHRRGELLAGDEGTALIRTSEAWMRSQEIRNASRMTALLAPGNYAVAAAQ